MKAAKNESLHLWGRLGLQSRGESAAICVLVMCVAALVLAAPSSASVSHALGFSFGGAGSNPSNPYPLAGGPNDVEVDQETHDVYVTDPSNHRVEKFDSSGHFLLMFGKGVDLTTPGNVCPVNPGDVCQSGTSASSGGAFELPYYLAVDNSGGPSNGDVYVADNGDHLVQKFDSSGHLITSWGAAGQKDGSDASDLPVYGEIYGIAVGNHEGDLYIGGLHYSYNVWEYTPSGVYEPTYQNTGGEPWLKADSAGNLYFSYPVGGFFGGHTVAEGFLRHGQHGLYEEHPYGTANPLTGFNFDPSTRELYQDMGPEVAHYSSDCNPLVGPCDPVDYFGAGELGSGAGSGTGVGVDGTSHTVYVADAGANEVRAFIDVRPIVTTTEPTELRETSVTLNGHIDPVGPGAITSCRFEYGFAKTYGASVPCEPDPASNPPGSNFTTPTDVKATVPGLTPGAKDHYRLVVTNSLDAKGVSVDKTFATTQAPAIDGLASENLTVTTADLNAQINPNGLETTYRFEYGTTRGYGQSAPVPDGTLSASTSDQAASAHLEELVSHVVYHYRLVAINADGTTASEDHTFNFYPPGCPNENVRQQTQANFLPDCRAYELVSPSDAAGTQLYPGGPNTGYATNPSRFAYTGLFSTIPSSGGSPIDGSGDLYIATRTAAGWVTKYVGPPANEAVVAGGPPQGLWGQGGAGFLGNRASVSAAGFSADILQNNVLTDPHMNTFLDWNDGGQLDQNFTPIGTNAPYVWSADGARLDRWPTNLASVPDGSYPPGSNLYAPVRYNDGLQPLTTAPGGVHALDCPSVATPPSDRLTPNECPGEVSASSDLGHYVFGTEWNVFAPGGTLTPPGSVYDNNTKTGTVVVASKTPAGEPIPAEPTDQVGDPLQVPAVSSDGSHIVMGSSVTGPCGLANCPTPPCGEGFGGKVHCPSYPSHLYMRVDGSVTYDVSMGHAVAFAGMTSDGSKVYFTSGERLTSEDTDSSVDLYMWSEATNSLTLASQGSAGTGNTDSCSAEFTTNCGIVLYSGMSYCQLPSGLGGNCRSDTSMATSNGDIYFFSPEQLDGNRGLPNKENLYDYRNGQAQYVTTFTTGPYCYPTEIFSTSSCGVESEGPVLRMEVTPDDSHMAFVTASPVTQYDNAGHLEMYIYDPATRIVTCVSCIPSGAPPTSDVAGSEDGLFLTSDGRTFFTTNDALVHADTNEAQDVYEYVDGRPQLITLGTGDTSQPRALGENLPGLVGVSADGLDVFFSTYDTLAAQDHNGLFLKFYDARASGGFSALAPPPPCNAADECHGVGSSPAAQLANGTGASLGSSGSVSRPTAHHRKHHKKVKHKRHSRRKTRPSQEAGR